MNPAASGLDPLGPSIGLRPLGGGQVLLFRADQRPTAFDVPPDGFRMHIEDGLVLTLRPASYEGTAERRARELEEELRAVREQLEQAEQALTELAPARVTAPATIAPAAAEATVPRLGYGPHDFPGVNAAQEKGLGEFFTSNCSHGCGAWMGSTRSGGPTVELPEGFPKPDPLLGVGGPCPRNPTTDPKEQVQQ